MATQKKITVSSAVDGELLFADKSMVVIVVRNLLTNAIKYSKNGSAVEVKSQREMGRVKISVKDNGVGMDDADVKKLFKPEESTYTIRNSSEKGVGIGLLLCKELIEKNNGSISATSKRGEGSIFTIELPAV